MHTIRHLRLRTTALGAAILFASIGAALSGPAGATSPALPQTGAAQAAAEWLGDQLTPGGYIPGSSAPDLSSTANTVLALAAAGVDGARAETALAYLEANSSTYIAANGSDGPGQLSLLILDAHALGVDPTNFGGTNLVARLLATETTTGLNAGRFGTDAQVSDFNAGPYDQGLALTALKAAGVTADANAIGWEQDAQCPNGGWTSPDSVTTPCDGDPTQYAGPDTNTTALAIEGLAAQDALTTPISTSALAFLEAAQDADDAGWGYDPNPDQSPGNSDPDSTSLVIQALLAMGQSPTSPTFTKSGNTPVSALLTFTVTSGPDMGAIYSPYGSPTQGDLLATYQSVPALAGLNFPVNPPAAPSVTALAPASGIVTGGTSVTITGQHFSNALAVSFGATAAPSFTVNSDTSITALSPAGATIGSVDVTVTTLGGTSATSTADAYTYEPTGGPYSPLSATRICDTRPRNPSDLSEAAAQCNGVGNAGTTLTAGSTRVINAAGSFGIPANATAVVLNVTAVNPQSSGHLTVFPFGSAQPSASNLNFAAGQVVPNLVEVGVGINGEVSMFSSASTDVLVDLEGYVSPVALGGSGAGLYTPLTAPSRICDTRTANPSSLSSPESQCNGTNNGGSRLSPGEALVVRVGGLSNVPTTATAAVLNVTDVNPSVAGHFTVFPNQTNKPMASNLNFSGGQTTTNRVIVPLSLQGKISIVSSASADAIVDVSGYFTAAGGTGTTFTPVPSPVRICDTRTGNPSALSGSYAQCDGKTLGTAGKFTVNVAGLAGVPGNARAVVVNLTGVNPSASTYFSLFPGPRLPSTSDLNVSAGTTRSNLVVVALSASGSVTLYNRSGSADAVIDVLGWYS